ncbi:MAG: transposase [Permianibacter sp.]
MPQEALARHRWPNGFACPHSTSRAFTWFKRGTLPYWECLRCHYPRPV